MTDGQFNALATLLRMREGASKSAARDVLVGGKSVSAAAADHNLTYQGAWNVVKACRLGIELATAVTGGME